MSYGAEIWGPALITALGSVGSGYLAGRAQPGESKIDKSKKQLIDRLLQSLEGNGPYSNLFNADESAFQKSVVDPAKSIFNNQIAPQIQQQYLATGQQRGTALEDQLLRAGVDLDSMINQQYGQFQQDAQNRKINAINSILGTSGGVEPNTRGQDFMNAAAGYLSSPSFSGLTASLFDKYLPQNKTTSTNEIPARKGFAPDWMDYNLGDSRWGQA